jgi:hypothetical protein
MQEGLCYFQFRRSVVVKAGRQMSTFPIVSDCAGHNILGPRPLAGTSAGQWILGGRLDPYWK